jgi:Mn2+/Fe2+ NRAMP family transporter
MRKLNQIAGPGLLFAATAIGVSHLVQSTTAGALYGFSLLGFVLAANLLKFPFFEFGSRYASVKGESLIEGYYQLHPFWLYAYLAITIISALFVTATVGAVTVGFMEHLFHLNEWTGFEYTTQGVLFGICVMLLLIGGFSLLDRLIKLLALVMVICTLIAFIASLFYERPLQVETYLPDIDNVGWAFLIPLMGWMPTAVDLSVWNSLWTVEKAKTSGYRPTLKETLREFYIGYWLSAGLAILFLGMGALLVFGQGKEVPTSAVAFSGFVTELYTTSIGKWSFLIIASASFCIMFSTFITVLDGYTRALKTSISLGFKSFGRDKNLERVVLFLLASLSFALIMIFESLGNFSVLVNTATTISFLIAPVVAVLNMKLIHYNRIGVENEPAKWLRWLGYLGIAYLIFFSIWFVCFSF